VDDLLQLVALQAVLLSHLARELGIITSFAQAWARSLEYPF
jgi:hypothetical protein